MRCEITTGDPRLDLRVAAGGPYPLNGRHRQKGAVLVQSHAPFGVVDSHLDVVGPGGDELADGVGGLSSHDVSFSSQGLPRDPPWRSTLALRGGVSVLLTSITIADRAEKQTFSCFFSIFFFFGFSLYFARKLSYSCFCRDVIPGGKQMKHEGMNDMMIVAKGVGAYPSVWARWDAAAKASGKRRQEWIRDSLNAAAEVVERSAARSENGAKK